MSSRRVLCASLLVAALAVSLIGDVSSQIVSTADRPDHGRHKARTAGHKKGHGRHSRGTPECPKGYFSNDDRCESCLSYSDKHGKVHAECEEPVHAHDPPADAHPTKPGRHEPRDPPCGIGSYRPGAGKDCVQCPFPKTTLRVGATNEDDCVCGSGSGKGPHCDECPTNMALIDSGVCGCLPGYGGANCEQCKAGTFSTGGQATNPRAPCQLCGLRLTSPPGSPAADFCECEAGFGADNTTLPMEERSCVPCKHGSFNPGPARTADDAAYFSIQSGGGRGFTGAPQVLACQSCDERNPEGGFTTLYAGAKSAAACLCKPGHGGLDCDPCAEGSFSGGGRDAVCSSCPSNGAGFTTVPAIAATSISACVCMPGYGLTDDGQCRMCEANSYSSGGSKQQCQICPFGTASRPGATSYWECKGDVAQKCPAGQSAPEDAVSIKQCRCLPGYGGGATAEAPCTICPVGTYSPGDSLDGCLPCAFGTTSKPGARSADECSSNRIEQPCPVGQVAPPDAVSAAQCGCMAGFGGTSKPTDPCTLCAPGTWSAGATTQPCEPCGVGFTSPAGATAADQCYAMNACPAGTQFPEGRKQHASVDECVCKPGYGSATGKAPCSLCPANTFSTGGTLEGCRPCAFGTTSNAGSTSEQACYSIEACPAGTEVHRSIQFPSSEADCVCKPGFGTDSGKAPCGLCKAATFSTGGSLEACKPCGFGKTSAEGATDDSQCVDAAQACPPGQEAPLGAVSRDQCTCKAGFGAGATPNDACTPCAAGTYADDGVCVPCAFGTTSGPGAASWTECRPAAQSCPIGQFAPEGAKSAGECRCFPGFGGTTSRDAPCTLCAAGTYSANKGTEACLPCDFGFTSPEGSDSKDDCHPVDECPAGTALFLAEGEVPSGPVDCRCRPGHGSVTGQVGAPCRRCAVGTWSAGGTNDDCNPCGWGKTSPVGATSEADCVDLRAACPYGKIAPPDAASGDECTCMPGYGIAKDGTCELCSPGTWSAGGANVPCVSCHHGFSSPQGAQSHEQCVPANACPAGTLYTDGGEQPFSLKNSCVCKPGYGTHDAGLCRLCSPGTWSTGGSADACRACGKGWTSEQGAISVHECFQEFELVPPKYVPTQQGGRDVIVINSPPGSPDAGAGAQGPPGPPDAGAQGQVQRARPGGVPVRPMQPGRPGLRANPSQLGRARPPQRPMGPPRTQHVGAPRMNTMRDIEMRAATAFHGPTVHADGPFIPMPNPAQAQLQQAGPMAAAQPQQPAQPQQAAAAPAPGQQPAAAAAPKTEQPAQQQPQQQPAAPKAGTV